MKRTLSTLSILTLGLVMSTFAYGQAPTAACCQEQAACCQQGASCCNHAACCDGGSCCQKALKAPCCDGNATAAMAR